MDYLDNYKRDNISESELNAAARKAEKKKNVLGKAFQKFKDLWALLEAVMSGRMKIPGKTKAIIIGAILYFLIPTDLIADFIPAVGYIDDITVIAMVYNEVKDLIMKAKSKGII
ncbi:YkvA family protein [Thermotoga sp. SG1]|uniref:YkvA family protein n=1 Tax=Thermotoga sp. SG1 TaxID=126739 RepID=UPI000C774A4F|nr:DUF1232 domain-containing protein [Thermotoga sp. SG1]PLV57144.1 hypothetical protein AS006_02280 [Thermotoga sp. SG1]